MPVAALGDDVLDAAWESLQARRMDWALDDRPDVEGFEVKLMGGAWVRASPGKDYDAFMGDREGGGAVRLVQYVEHDHVGALRH